MHFFRCKGTRHFPNQKRRPWGFSLNNQNKVESTSRVTLVFTATDRFNIKLMESIYLLLKLIMHLLQYFMLPWGYTPAPPADYEELVQFQVWKHNWLIYRLLCIVANGSKLCCWKHIGRLRNWVYYRKLLNHYLWAHSCTVLVKMNDFQQIFD